MIHLDLFSGIGGFAYAIDQMWPDVEHIFCEINPFCQQVLKKNFGKDVIIYGDIRTLTADAECKRSQEPRSKLETGWDRQFSETSSYATDTGFEEVRQKRQDEVFLLTGGFPCQPFSHAGKRRGTQDDRYLWPEMLRVIRDFKPTWIVAENVRGLLNIEQGMVFEQVCLDLEASGYEVQPLIIPAVAVNAPHRRDRVWIIAHASGWESRKSSEQEGRESFGGGSEKCDSYASDTASNGFQERHKETRKSLGEGKQGRALKFKRESWEQKWIEVATRLCGVDDGLPARMDGLELSKARHRVERLKALGNHNRGCL